MVILIFYYLIGFIWAVLTGLVFSTIGAAGGILASFGFLTLLRIHSPNSVKAMSQILVMISPAIALPVYLRQERFRKIKRIFFLLGLIIASGAIVGALSGSWFSKNYLYELKSFKFLFGLLSLFVVSFMGYNILKQKKKTHGEISSIKTSKSPLVYELSENKSGVRLLNRPSVVSVSIKRISFRCLDKDYSISPVIFFVTGFLIASISSVFGIGGGFLIVPFLTDIAGFPVFLATGISIFVVLISSLTSAVNYIRMSVPVIFPLLFVEIAGVILGSILGPKISKQINEIILKYFLMFFLVLIGIFYILKF